MNFFTKFIKTLVFNNQVSYNIYKVHSNKKKFLFLTGKIFSCQICHRSYSSKYILNQHMKVHDESKNFKCDVCLKVFFKKR